MARDRFKVHMACNGMAKTSPAIAKRLNGVLVVSLRDPANRKFLLEQNAEEIGSMPDQNEAYINAELAKWIKVAWRAGLEPQ
jgi:tripartite-type tricarboxylate transporter receptor subunit TctC